MHKIRGKVVGNPATTPMRLPDYEQNNPKKSSYILNRPFYTVRTKIVDGVLVSEYNIDFEREMCNVPAQELPNHYVDGSALPIIVEINDNGTVYSQKGYYDGFAVMDAYANQLYFEEASIDLGFMSEGKLWGNSYRESLDGVSVQIYTESVKQIDKTYLPKNDVPYVYGKEVIFGGVALSDLKTGAYVLHGYIDTMPAYGCYIPDFESKPTLCHLVNNDGVVKVYWLDADENGEGVCIRSLTVVDGDIVSDNTIAMTELTDGISAAVAAAEDAAMRVDGAYVYTDEQIENVNMAISALDEEIRIIKEALDL